MSSLFYSNPIQIHNNTIVISTDPYLYLIDSNTGTTIFKKAITSVTKPIVSGNNLFLITKDNLLVSIDLNSGKILYSLSISQEIGNFLDSKNKEINIRFLSMLDDNLFIFLNNSYVVQFNSLGSIEQINKLPAKLGSLPIFINNSILYLNKKNKLIILN